MSAIARRYGFITVGLKANFQTHRDFLVVFNDEYFLHDLTSQFGTGLVVG